MCPNSFLITVLSSLRNLVRSFTSHYYQDIEQGFSGKQSKEEAIDILIKAYKSSGSYQQVQTQVAEICGQVIKYTHCSPCTSNKITSLETKGSDLGFPGRWSLAEEEKPCWLH